MTDSAPGFVVAALYKFADIANCGAVKEPLRETCLDAGVTGTLILAPEGINGTIAGTRSGIDVVLQYMWSIPGLSDLEHKESYCDQNPFLRMKVRLKREIVTMGVPEIDPNEIVGTYVEPEDWNDLISDPDMVLIDARNDYEVGIGSFKGAVDPKIGFFREFPDWFQANRTDFSNAKFATFCTGGIRCEKATAFLKKEGVKEVYHLRGGILKYLERIPEAQSLWEDDCFVFDRRVSVGHGLAPGAYDMCHACRRPISDADKASENYSPGVSCPNCHDALSDDRRRRFRERQRQIEWSKRRGERHLGAIYPSSPRRKITASNS
ncbi:MAG: rhodanese-related sulfurtransferase [Methyloligellaceae bacterium]